MVHSCRQEASMKEAYVGDLPTPPIVAGWEARCDPGSCLQRQLVVRVTLAASGRPVSARIFDRGRPVSGKAVRVRFAAVAIGFQ